VLTIYDGTQGDKLLPELNDENIPGSDSHHDDDHHEGKVEDDEKDEVAYNYSFFHITFMLGVMYVYMIMTDWQIVSGASHSDEYVSHTHPHTHTHDTHRSS
jgi:hypothetical protein